MGTWKGFDGRVFLTVEEHMTYLRRPPVRYARRSIGQFSASETCTVCGKEASLDNPLQAAHRVPFTRGVQQWRLTPDWLDSVSNLVPAHRRKCNKLAEMSDAELAQ